MAADNEGDGAPRSELVLYRSEDDRTHVQVRLENGTVWLSQRQMAELYDIAVSSVNEHLKHIFDDGELRPEATLRKLRIVQPEGGRQVARLVDFYSLEAILAVGYRVRSQRGTQFRQWATERLREYVVKGFVLDDQRMKHPPGPGVPDTFDELLERIRDIRASEARVYLRMRDILALAADYQPSSDAAQTLFMEVQNKLHFAVTGKTAPELIAERADSTKANMGLTSWKGAVVRKADVTVAKNYLAKDEITELNRLVGMFLDYAEDQTQRRKHILMNDWKTKLVDFLKFNDRNVLTNAGRVSRETADHQAHEQFGLFEARRRADAEARGEEEMVDSLTSLEASARQLGKQKGKKS